MSVLSATTVVSCQDAAGLGRLLAEHLEEHGASVGQTGESLWALSAKPGKATIRVDGQKLRLDASSPDAEALMEMKYLLTSHLGEFNRDNFSDILWQGDGDEIASLPNLRCLTVVGARDLSPHIRRITFRSDNLRRFDDATALHAKLLFPRENCPLLLPRLTTRGLIDWGADGERPLIRKYTIRHVDPVSGLIDMEFVLHTDGGPGSSFAESAGTGDMIGMIGPGGGSAPQADWSLFAGDETALPAIARLIERLPPEARGVALIEVADHRDEQEIRHDSGMEIRWLHRKSATRSQRLSDLVKLIEVSASNSIFAWAGTEFDDFRKIRTHWRSSNLVGKQQSLAVSYWRQGQAQA